MDALRVFAVVALVLLAGCFGILGGDGGDATETPGSTDDPGLFPNATGSGTDEPSGTEPGTATTSPTGTASATPTPSNGTSSTATDVPDAFETVSLENESLGLSLDLTGDPATVASGATQNVTGTFLTAGGVLHCARASPFARVVTNGTVADATVTMSYDETRLPAGTDESDLAVFAFNGTIRNYLQMNGSVDAANDTVAGTEIDGRLNTFRNDETGETLRVVLDGTRLDNAFVVMHAPTFWEGVDTGEVPDHCTNDGDGTSTDDGDGTSTVEADGTSTVDADSTSDGE